MFAFPAAKRTLVLMTSLALVIGVATAQAGEDKGYLGVMLQDISPSMAKALQLDEETGVMISNVVDESPAAAAGLEDGDVILEFAGQSISGNDDLIKAVRGTSPGDEVKVVVLRGGKKKTLDVEIGEHQDKNVFIMSEGDVHHAPHFEHFGGKDHHVMVWSDDDDFTWTMGKDMPFGLNPDRGFLGVHLDNLNGQLGEYFGVEDGKGALVTEVVEDSPAAAAGLKAGDVIVQMGETDVDSPEALHQAMADTEPEQQMAVKVVRRGQTKSLSVTLGDLPEDAISKHIEIIGEGDDHWSIHTAPRMMKHFGDHGDVDVRVIRRAPGAEFEVKELQELLQAEGEV